MKNAASVASDELPAWVVVYEDLDDGAPGAALGHVAMSTSPRISLGVDLTRFVAPVETLWVAVHGDRAPLGTFDANDPTLLGADRAPLRTAISVTNGACDGLATKLCDPARPHVIAWLDCCGAPATTTTPCGPDAVCATTADRTCAVAPCPRPVPGHGRQRVRRRGSDCDQRVADLCGVPCTRSPRAAARHRRRAHGTASCRLAASCAGNTTKVCDPAAPSVITWLDACGEPNGNTIPCGATSTCDDSGPEPTCTVDPGCGGATTLACDDADPTELYWLDACGAPTGSTIPCGANTTCVDADGEARCVNPRTPCAGLSQKFCDPDDLSAIKWLDGCGRVKASTIPCGSGYACSDAAGEPRCVTTDTCGGNTTTVCVDDDPGHVYWVDACGALTGSTYPCGVATCDDSGGAATCKIIGTCADERLRVCDPDDPTSILLTNACGDDLGVFSTCNNGKRCNSEATPGQATCACVPTDEVRCFGKHFLDQPSGVVKIDSCGVPERPRRHDRRQRRDLPRVPRRPGVHDVAHQPRLAHVPPRLQLHRLRHLQDRPRRRLPLPPPRPDAQRRHRLQRRRQPGVRHAARLVGARLDHGRRPALPPHAPQLERVSTRGEPRRALRDETVPRPRPTQGVGLVVAYDITTGAARCIVQPAATRCRRAATRCTAAATSRSARWACCATR